jgi:polar amino acid transport system substrate-binding protein
MPGGATALALFLLGVSACTTLPRDPEKTLQRVQQQHHVRVGIVESPPWVIRTGGEPAGAEVELVRRFAASLGGTPEWFWGGEQEHMEALERFELDLVIGDLDASTPWKKKIALTRPYFEEQIAVGVPKQIRMPRSLKGLPVAVQGGDVAAAYLRRSTPFPFGLAPSPTQVGR